MRAAVFHGPGQPLRIETVPDPVPGRGQALIKINRCGICGTDLHMTSGHGWTYAAGTVNGHEYSGEVLELGQGVDSLRVGNRIAVLPMAGCGRCDPCRRGFVAMCPERRGQGGGFGEYLCVSADSAVKLPESLSFADGALVEPLAVGLHGVALARMQQGARVLVMGGGSMALAAIYWARHLGAGRVVALSRSQRRSALVAEMGADAYIKSGADEVERLEAALGGPPEVVFECVGVEGMLARAIDFVAPEGTVVSMGFCTAPDPIVPALATLKEVRLIFSMTYTMAEFHHVIDTFNAGRVEPRAMISETITLDELPDALEIMRIGSTQTKVQVEL